LRKIISELRKDKKSHAYIKLELRPKKSFLPSHGGVWFSGVNGFRI